MKAADLTALISAIASLLLAIVAVTFTVLNYYRGSEVTVFPLEQAILFADDRFGGAPVVMLEVAQINSAEGNFGDVLRDQSVEISVDGGLVGCYRARAYAEVRFHPEAMAAPPPAEAEASIASPLDEASESVSIAPPRCPTQECIHLVPATIEVSQAPLVHGLPPGQLVALRPIFDTPYECGVESPATFDDLVGRIAGQSTRIRYLSQTWKDGEHDAVCDLEVPVDWAEGMQRGRFAALNCNPPSPPP